MGIVRRLANSGFRVIAIARTESGELELAKRQAEEAGGSLHFVSSDLADIESIPDLAKRLRQDFGPIYALVNNAGMSTDGVLALTHISQIEQVVRLNTISPIVLTKYVVRTMMADGEGRVVNISSIVASTGYSGLSVYAATKASLVGFTRSLAREVGRMGVTVNAVAPGFVNTDMTQGITDEQRDKIARRSALRRLVEVDDVANAVEFLLDDRSKNITGTVLTVDAGEYSMSETLTRRATGTGSSSHAWMRALELTAPIARNRNRVLPDVIQEIAARMGSAPALLSNRESFTYKDLSERANRYARWALYQGLGKGDVVCLMMANRPEYMAIWLGITSVGMIVSLLNTNLTGPSLAHCIRTVSPKCLIVEAEYVGALTSALPHLELAPAIWAHGPQSAELSRIDIEVALLSGDPFDSG